MSSQKITAVDSAALIQLYRAISFKEWLHVVIRSRLFPFERLAQFLPESGNFLDIGCGHGFWVFYMAQAVPDSTIYGVDPDEEKIAVARQIQTAGQFENVTFQVNLAQEAELPRCQVVTIVDVMYLIPHEEQEAILRAAIASLESGGLLLLKEMSEQPRWKYAWNWFEEWLVVRVLNLTYGDKFYFRTTTEWRALLQKMGLNVEVQRLDRGYIHPHILFIGKKP